MNMAHNTHDNPLDMIRLQVKFPQFSGNVDAQNENMKNLFAMNYTQ